MQFVVVEFPGHSHSLKFICLCLTSHQELSHMEMEPLIKVSTDRV